MKKILMILSLVLAVSFANVMNAQDVNNGVPFGTSWGETLIGDLSAAVTADPEAKSYNINGLIVTPDVPGQIVVDTAKKHFRMPVTVSFVAAEAGNACLRMKVKVPKGKRVLVYCGNKRVKDSVKLDNQDSETSLIGTFDINVPNVKAGDVIRIESLYTNYTSYYSFAWNKAE